MACPLDMWIHITITEQRISRSGDKSDVFVHRMSPDLMLTVASLLYQIEDSRLGYHAEVAQIPVHCHFDIGLDGNNVNRFPLGAGGKAVNQLQCIFTPGRLDIVEPKVDMTSETNM